MQAKIETMLPASELRQMAKDLWEFANKVDTAYKPGSTTHGSDDIRIKFLVWPDREDPIPKPED